MPLVRRRILERYPHVAAPGHAPDDDLSDACYALLRSIDVGVSVDGWKLFRIVRESAEGLEVVGLMTLLPSGMVPIAIQLRTTAGGLAWSIRIGRLDAAWLALSDDKQWNGVYLYSTGVDQALRWAWDRQRDGEVQTAS